MVQIWIPLRREHAKVYVIILYGNILKNMKFICFMLLFSICCPSGGEGLCQNDQFSRIYRVDFSEINSERITSNMEIRSLTKCAQYCMTENGCESFSYTENTRTCDTYSKAQVETTAALSSSTICFSKPLPSGVSDYTVTGGPTIQVYMDMDTKDGPWIVIQRRTSGDVDFYRNWADYKGGFGDLHRDFWLGNDNIHLLTSTPMILRIVLEGWYGKIGYAQYSSFQIANEAQNYRLSVSGFSGNVSYNALGPHDGYAFSTYDRDNDVKNQENCASSYKGAWWYTNCHVSNLNGLYMVDVGETEVTSMLWRNFPRSDIGAPLKKCTMMIRKP